LSTLCVQNSIAYYKSRNSKFLNCSCRCLALPPLATMSTHIIYLCVRLNLCVLNDRRLLGLSLRGEVWAIFWSNDSRGIKWCPCWEIQKIQRLPYCVRLVAEKLAPKWTNILNDCARIILSNNVQILKR